MFAVHPLSAAATEPKPCASCGRETRPAGAIRGRLPSLRPALVGFVCAPCVAWAERWKAPLVTSSGGSVTPDGVDGEADEFAPIGGFDPRRGVYLPVDHSAVPISAGDADEPPANFGSIDPRSMPKPGGFFADDTPLPEDLGRVDAAETATHTREPAPTVNPGTVPPGHTLSPAGIVVPVESEIPSETDAVDPRRAVPAVGGGSGVGEAAVADSAEPESVLSSGRASEEAEATPLKGAEAAAGESPAHSRWTPALDERLLFGARAGSSSRTIGSALGFEAWEVDERLEQLCPEPRNATTIGAALKRVRGLA